MKRLFMITAAALAFAAPVVASAAQSGYVTSNVNLRAGPDIDYPGISSLREGTPLAIFGCVDRWEWCDVAVGDDRGWVPGNFIAYDYQDRPVLLSSYGQRIGIPIVSFSVGNYWDSYYRNRPFYADHARWYNRPHVRRAPPVAIIGWDLRFGRNGRWDHGRWDHHDNDRGWDRRDQRNDRNHGRLYPLPHPVPDQSPQRNERQARANPSNQDGNRVNRQQQPNNRPRAQTASPAQNNRQDRQDKQAERRKQKNGSDINDQK